MIIDMLLHAVKYCSSRTASTLEEGGHILRSSSARCTNWGSARGASAPTSAVLLQGRHISIQQYSATGIFFPLIAFSQIFGPIRKMSFSKGCPKRMQNQAIVALKGCVVNSCLRSSVTFLVMNRLLLCSAFSNRVATMLFHVLNENLF